MAYDFALANWEKTFGEPVFGRSCFWGVKRTVWKWLDRGAQGYWAYGGATSKHGWPLLLGSLAIGGDGPACQVTFPETPFTWRGPFQGNLRSYLQVQLARLALQQTKQREKGVFVGDAQVNRMKIRIPHR
jgi:hypothetical protein